MREQWLAAGAAPGNLLNAAHHLGHGAIVLSGERCFDPLLLAQLSATTISATPAGESNTSRPIRPPR